MTLIVTWLWQGLAIAWITAAAVRTMPRLNAATRHAIWWLALAAVLAIPVAHGLEATGRPSAPNLTPLDVDVAGALMLPAFPDAVVAGAAALWAMTTAVGVLRIARSCRALVRLKRTSSPFDRSRAARLPLWVAACDGGHRTAELRTSDCMTGACALGLGRPVILVSRSVAGALSDESLDEIVMHEQAHLDRYDDWSQLLVAVVGSLAGWHPAVRFLARRLDVDREAACDDRVVSRTGATRRYASSLLAVAAASNPEAGGAGFAAGVPGATTTASVLRVRVSRLLDPRRDRGARLAGATSLVSVAALALAVVMSTQVAPVVIFVETAAGNAPDAAAAPAHRKGDGSLFTKNEKRDPSPISIERPTRRALRGVKRPAAPSPPEAAARPLASTTPDTHPTAPLDSRVVAADANTPVLLMSLPSSQPAAIALSPVLAASPWEAVRTSTTSAASGIARDAKATGARVWSRCVSIGRFVTRASKAGANVF
jgi:beta-lactamase regulating signal transducer with metallopeptidase domain